MYCLGELNHTVSRGVDTFGTKSQVVQDALSIVHVLIWQNLGTRLFKELRIQYRRELHILGLDILKAA